MASSSHPRLVGEDLYDAIRQAARCRATRFHRLELIPGDPDKRPWTGAMLTYRCELCGTIRRDVVQRRTGVIISRSYDPPDWYIAANDSKEDPAWWRAKWWEGLDDSLFMEAAAPTKTVTPIRKNARKKRA
jgi:hypothetical protein